MANEVTDILINQLRSLGIQLGSELPIRNNTNFVPLHDADISDLDIYLNNGTVITREMSYPSTYHHGKISLFPNSNKGKSLLTNAPIDLLGVNTHNCLFLDIETTSMTGGTGTIPFLIGVGYYCDDHFKLIQLFLRNPGEEASMLNLLHQYISKKDTLITYNGKSFDLPIITSRYILNGLNPSFNRMHHLDLLHISRRLFKYYLDSCTLSDVENQILDFKRGRNEIQGWLIPGAYRDYLIKEDHSLLPYILIHNENDILSLAALYNFINSALDTNCEDKLLPGSILAGVARFFVEANQFDYGLECYDRSLEEGIPIGAFLGSLRYFEKVYKREQRYERIIRIWEEAASNNDTKSMIELSKYYEYKEKNYLIAISWAEKALASINVTFQQNSDDRSVMNLVTRIDRIKHKYSKNKFSS